VNGDPNVRSQVVNCRKFLTNYSSVRPEGTGFTAAVFASIALVNYSNESVFHRQNISVIQNENGLLIRFPKEFEAPSLSGTVYFQRLSNEKLDFSKDIKDNLSDHTLYISDEQLVDGKWELKIDWKVEGEAYMYKETLFY
jgi:hypothetical protein